MKFPASFVFTLAGSHPSIIPRALLSFGAQLSSNWRPQERGLGWAPTRASGRASGSRVRTGRAGCTLHKDPMAPRGSAHLQCGGIPMCNRRPCDRVRMDALGAGGRNPCHGTCRSGHAGDQGTLAQLTEMLNQWEAGGRLVVGARQINLICHLHPQQPGQQQPQPLHQLHLAQQPAVVASTLSSLLRTKQHTPGLRPRDHGAGEGAQAAAQPQLPGRWPAL